MAKFIDLTGDRYGRLVVLRRIEVVGERHAHWLCRCDCGEESVVRSNSLRRGMTRSCGCQMRAGAGRKFTARPGYRAMHHRVSKMLGSAREQSCVDCGGQAAEWSYDNSDPDEITGMSGDSQVAYSLDQSRYQPRCIPCHRAFDGTHILAQTTKD